MSYPDMRFMTGIPSQEGRSVAASFAPILFDKRVLDPVAKRPFGDLEVEVLHRPLDAQSASLAGWAAEQACKAGLQDRPARSPVATKGVA